MSLKKLGLCTHFEQNRFFVHLGIAIRLTGRRVEPGSGALNFWEGMSSIICTIYTN